MAMALLPLPLGTTLLCLCLCLCLLCTYPAIAAADVGMQPNAPQTKDAGIGREFTTVSDSSPSSSSLISSSSSSSSLTASDSDSDSNPDLLLEGELRRRWPQGTDRPLAAAAESESETETGATAAGATTAADESPRASRYRSFLAKTPNAAEPAAPATVQIAEEKDEKEEKEKEEEEDEEEETESMWIIFAGVAMASLYKFILSKGWCSSCLGTMPETDYVLIGPNDDPEAFRNDPPRPPSRPKPKTTPGIAPPLRPSTGSSGSRTKR